MVYQWQSITLLSCEKHLTSFVTIDKNVPSLVVMTEVFFSIKYRVLALNGVVVRASASHSVDLGFIALVESYQNTLKNGIHSFPAWRSAFRGGFGEEAGKFACCVLGQGT